MTNIISGPDAQTASRTSQPTHAEKPPFQGNVPGTSSSDPTDQHFSPPNNKSIAFTRLRGPDGSRLTKKFSLSDKGSILKNSQPVFTDGAAETVKLDKLSEIESVIDGLGSNECISTGVFDSPSCKIVTKDRLTETLADAGVRSRSKDQMRQPHLGLALLDHDPTPYMPEQLRCDSPDELIAKLRTAIPQLKFVAYSGTGSCSNGIYNTETMVPYIKGGGFHVYISVKSIDLKDFRLFLEVKQWYAGMGYLYFARNGAMLTRGIVDLSVLSPERLIYEAAPILGDGLSRHPRVWQHRGGPMLSGDFSLTPDEITAFHRRVAEVKTDPVNLTKSQELQDAYREVRVEELAQYRSISRQEARKLIPRQTAADLEKKEQMLSPNEMVEIKGEKLLTSELWTRGREFDNAAMPDPIEGVAYGTGTAIFYFNNGNQPCIRSHAHGRITTYRLSGHDEFKPCDTIVVEPFKQAPESPPTAAYPLDKYSLKGLSAELEAQALEQTDVLSSIALLGQWTVIYARHNVGKTLLVLFLLIEAIKNNMIPAGDIYYFDLDDTQAGLTEKLQIAEEWGFHMLCDGYRDFKASEFVLYIAELCTNDQARGKVLILDTLKKLTDLMDKRKASRFGETIRRFISKGGTVIGLAHVNKNPGSDGKSVYSGTTDIIDDADCAYVLDLVTVDEDTQTKVVEFENRKRRGNVTNLVAYRYSNEDGLSYHELLASVSLVNEVDLVTVKQTESLKTDVEIIDAVKACINDGVTTKMRLRDAVSQHIGISKRDAVSIIEKYQGPDPEKHYWTFTVGDRGAKVYSILEGVSHA